MHPATDTDPGAAATPRAVDPPRPAVDRALAYGWLAALFTREPDADTLTAYAGEEWATLFDALAKDAALAPAVAALRDLLGREPEATSLDLAVLFGRLFYGVGGPRTVPPYESAFVSARGTLFQEPVSELNAVIARLGLSVAESFSEPSDHIAVELTVMSELARRLDAALASGAAAAGLIAEQRDLLDDHLLVWLPEFRDGCAAQAPDTLYATAAQAVLDFARQDRQWLAAAAEALAQTQV